MQWRTTGVSLAIDPTVGLPMPDILMSTSSSVKVSAKLRLSILTANLWKFSPPPPPSGGLHLRGSTPCPSCRTLRALYLQTEKRSSMHSCTFLGSGVHQLAQSASQQLYCDLVAIPSYPLQASCPDIVFQRAAQHTRCSVRCCVLCDGHRGRRRVRSC